MITATASYVLYEGSEIKYTSTTLYADFKYDNRFEMFAVEIIPLGAAASAPPLSSYVHLLTKAAVDAKTGTGTETEALLEAVELCIIDYLDAITENSAVTFTN